MLLAAVAMATEEVVPWKLVTSAHVADVIRSNCQQSLVIDSRSFLEYNTHHIARSVNVCCSKLVKRRLQQDKVSVRDLLAQTCAVDTETEHNIIVYDQCTVRPDGLAPDCFLMVLLRKLVRTFHTVALLKGGFLDFQASHPSLCESKTTCCMASGTGGAGGYKCPPLTSMSQPCLPVSNVGPTKILPFLFLGSQHDALSEDTLTQNGITYVLNVSTSCPRPPYISESHFLRIPVNDNHCDKLSPFFAEAFQFLDKVREASGSVLVHCLAGISRSPTLAIAYVMKQLSINTDEAYKYVKDKRPTISPNFNFMGQLLAFENQMKAEQQQQQEGAKKPCLEELGVAAPATPLPTKPRKSFKPFVFNPAHAGAPAAAQSPTTALSKLSFASTQPSPLAEEPEPSPTAPTFPLFPTTSLDQVVPIPCRADKPIGGSKRPFSISSIDLPSESGHVAMRSPEMRPKRPSVRPNSIAFSSYPHFELSDLSPKLDTKLRRPSPEHGQTLDLQSDSSDHLPASLEQGRKSRSLEDILNSPEAEEMAPTVLQCTCAGAAASAALLRHRRRKKRPLQQQQAVADLFGAGAGLSEQCRFCHGAPDRHQSNSSMSSSGGSSLHGSLEVIQVS